MQASTRTDRAPPPVRNISFDQRLREIDMFFAGVDRVHQTMNRVADKLEAAGIAYCIVGGMAVNAHKHERTTKDVDFLVTLEGLRAFKAAYVPGEFEPVRGRPRRFVDPSNDVNFDFLVTGLFPGSGKPGPFAYPEPTSVAETILDRPVVRLAMLIQLKLAARRYQDFADVVSLIGVNNLDESFLEQLHPTVQNDYLECLEEKRREDQYDAVQDEAMTEVHRQIDEEAKDSP